MFPVWKNDITGDAWGDMDTPRGHFLKLLLETMFACCRCDKEGTCRKDEKDKAIPDFMYEGDIPKISARYEVQMTTKGEDAGFRVWFFIHDPAYKFYSALQSVINENKDLATNGKNPRARRIKPLRSNRKPGTEYRDLKSLDIWRKWLMGAYPEDAARLDPCVVHNVNKHISSADNPANPHEVYSVERQIKATAVPVEAKTAQYVPVDKQLNPGEYRAGLRRADDVGESRGEGDEEEASYFEIGGRSDFHVDGVRFRGNLQDYRPRDQQGAGGRGEGRDRRDPAAGGGAAAAAGDDQQAGAAGGRDGGNHPESVVTFPHPEYVYPLPIGPDLSPKYIFRHLRPDKSQNAQAVTYRENVKHTLSVQDKRVLIKDEEIAARQEAIKALERDMNLSVESMGRETGPEESLAKTDMLLAMRRENERALVTLCQQYPEGEERKVKLLEFKKAKLNVLVDKMMNRQDQAMNPNMKAIRNWLKQQLEERGTLVGHTYAIDPKLGTFGNMMAKANSYWDQIVQGYASHSLFLSLWPATLTAYRPEPGMCVNKIILGDPDSGKSFGLKQIMKRVLIPGTVQWVTRATLRANQEAGDRNGTINFFDEGDAVLFGNDSGGKREPTADPFLKSSLTTGFARVDRCEQQPDGSFNTIQNYSGCTSSNFVLTNRSADDLDPAITSRFSLTSVQDVDRDVNDVSKLDFIHGNWEEDPEKASEMSDEFFFTIQGLTYMVEACIKAKIMKDVDPTIIRHHVLEFEKLIKEKGLAFNERDAERLEMLGRTLTIMTVIYQLFLSEQGEAYKKQSWSWDFLLDVEPLLTTPHAIASEVIGRSIPSHVPEDSSRILYHGLLQSGNVIPRANSDDDIINSGQVEFATGATFLDTAKEGICDWVKLGPGTPFEIAKRIHETMGKPTPSLETIKSVFRRLEEQTIRTPNRDPSGKVIRKSAMSAALPDDSVASCKPDSISTSDCHPRVPIDDVPFGQDVDEPAACAPAPQATAAVDGKAKQAQSVIRGVREAEQPTNHVVKALMVEKVGRKSTTYIATQLLLHPRQFQSLATDALLRACHKFMRPMWVPTGSAYVDGEGKSWVNLIQFVHLNPRGDAITIRHLFDPAGMGLPIYADASTTDMFKDAKCETAVTRIEEDWETLRFYERINSLVPEKRISYFLNFVPKHVEEDILPAMYKNPEFLEQIGIEPIRYPQDLAIRAADRERLYRDVVSGDARALKDPRVRICTDTAKSFARFYTGADVRRYLPTTYVNQNVLKEKMELAGKATASAEEVRRDRKRRRIEGGEEEEGEEEERRREERKKKEANEEEELSLEKHAEKLKRCKVASEALDIPLKGKDWYQPSPGPKSPLIFTTPPIHPPVRGGVLKVPAVPSSVRLPPMVLPAFISPCGTKPPISMASFMTRGKKKVSSDSTQGEQPPPKARKIAEGSASDDSSASSSPLSGAGYQEAYYDENSTWDDSTATQDCKQQEVPHGSREKETTGEPQHQEQGAS